jgi:hypothetical protein
LLGPALSIKTLDAVAEPGVLFSETSGFLSEGVEPAL